MLFEKVRTKFRSKKTLTKFQSNGDNRCKVLKQLFKHKTNINSFFTNFFPWFNKLLRCTDFFLQLYDRGHKLVSLWSVSKKNRGPDPQDPSPTWEPGIYLGILIRQGQYMDRNLGRIWSNFHYYRYYYFLFAHSLQFFRYCLEMSLEEFNFSRFP